MDLPQVDENVYESPLDAKAISFAKLMEKVVYTITHAVFEMMSACMM